MELLILVDERDNEIGYEEKVKCHLGEGRLHRAFSIFVFNSKGKFLIQKRSEKKLLWPGFWANTCCSHPRKGEDINQAIHRRLVEEVGFDCELKEIFKFIYHAKFKNIGFERECDHVFIGRYNGEITPNPDEVSECKWISADELKKDIEENPDKYTPWFKLSINRVIDSINSYNLHQ